MTGDNQRDERRGARLTQWLAAFARQTRGNVAMMFALALPLLLMVGLGAVDIHQASRVKANLQDALDAAALVAARSSHTDKDEIQKVGMDALKANMPDYFKGNPGDTASFVLNQNVLVASAKVNVKVLVANIILPPYGKLLDDYLPVSTSSEVLRASRNVEVGMALDVTGSMAGSRLKALKEAASELVDIVVQDQQTPFYSKIGLAPYSQGVNLGGRAAEARGGYSDAKAITNIEWYSGDIVQVTSATRTNPAVFTASGHKFSNDDLVYVTVKRGTTSLNNGRYYITKSDNGKFQLSTSKSGSSISLRNSNGSGDIEAEVAKCTRSDCSVKITSANHGYSNGNAVRFEAIEGLVGLNGVTSLLKDRTANDFIVDHTGFPLSAYTKGGEIWCTTQGCRFFRFLNYSGGYSTHEISTCVSERTGTHAYTDAAPATALVGRNYPAQLNECPGTPVMPLSTSRADLKAAINGMTETGTTAGHIGIAWAWYLVSPQFANFWGGTAAPGETKPSETLKVVVLMTDGEFNTAYCDGVVTQETGAPTSWIPRAAQIKCNALNGNGFQQSVRLCNAMKAQGVIVYTVGFQISSNRGGSGVDTAVELMETCATSKATHFHNATSDTDLRDAFRAIGRDITRLRLAR